MSARGPFILRSALRPNQISFSHSLDPKLSFSKLVGCKRQIYYFSVLLSQKSGLAARGTSASFPGYHWVFSAQTCSTQSAGPNP